jgi:hypothetical protein
MTAVRHVYLLFCFKVVSDLLLRVGIKLQAVSELRLGYCSTLTLKFNSRHVAEARIQFTAGVSCITVQVLDK